MVFHQQVAGRNFALGEAVERNTGAVAHRLCGGFAHGFQHKGEDVDVAGGCFTGLPCRNAFADNDQRATGGLLVHRGLSP